MSSGNIELRLNFSLCNHLNSSLKFILKFSLIFSVLSFQKFYKRTLLNLLLLKIDQQSCSLNYDSKNTRPNLLANTSAICPLRRNRRSVITSRTFKPISSHWMHFESPLVTLVETVDMLYFLNQMVILPLNGIISKTDSSCSRMLG